MATALFALSTEYLTVPVHATSDPTSDTVEFAFTADPATQPTSDDWTAGSWDSTVTTSPYSARILLGPGTGGLVLTAGTYAIWLRITDSPEIPVRQPGQLVVT